MSGCRAAGAGMTKAPDLAVSGALIMRLGCPFLDMVVREDRYTRLTCASSRLADRSYGGAGVCGAFGARFVEGLDVLEAVLRVPVRAADGCEVASVDEDAEVAACDAEEGGGLVGV